MMCSRLLKHAGEEMTVPGLAAVSRGIDRMVEFYHRTLLWVLQRQRATLILTLATIVATVMLYIMAPKVAISETGTEMLGMNVAHALRRKTKTTTITSPIEMSMLR